MHVIIRISNCLVSVLDSCHQVTPWNLEPVSTPVSTPVQVTPWSLEAPIGAIGDHDDLLVQRDPHGYVVIHIQMFRFICKCIFTSNH